MLLTIGLEIHIKLKSTNKMFCQCKNQQNFDDLLPNTNICPVCTGQPGALPTLSDEVVKKSLLLGKALKCTINRISTFDRKSYFYPDLPMGYQITQLYHPTNTKGQVSFFLNNYTHEKIINIQDAHMENDTGKMIHDHGQALIDFNRAGTPLVEIVTLPDFRNAEEVIEFLKELQRIVRYNDIADADLEKGQMRVDVNISLRESENDPYGTRAEIKNINSFGMIKRAIEHEQARQEKIYQSGKTFTQQTRGRDDTKSESYLMRSKEDALDYRYFPEPDLPPLEITNERYKRLDEQTIVIPHEIIKKFKEEYGFNKEYINALISDKEVLDYFLTIVSHCKEGNDEAILGKLTAKRISGPIAARLKENFTTIDTLKFTPGQFNEFLVKAQAGSLIENQLKIVMEEMLSTGRSSEEIIKEKGFDTPTMDSDEITILAKQILEENTTIVEQYKGGKTTTIGFFIGQLMKKTGGKTSPKIAQEIFEKLLK
ncbi:MAG TPA: Asp-tRNA(Asn)/Glu-tRNA(Gln) amidotransferase subunit GatB [Candidatus Absconditabacterales bacterium]|nr:Asp-tRNA(Asn)/Glu-tRNA(Gln) amidotransferase subunit GatB [Candidatus Absconditabacterales bacterium]